MRVLIVGCGYVGIPLGAELVRKGHEVFGLRRTPNTALETAGIKPVLADLTQSSQLRDLPASYDWVVNTVSSSHGGVEDYRRVYLDGTRNLVDWLRPNPPKKFIYTSSTSVYAQEDHSLVKETSPTEPSTETSKILVETEHQLLAAWQEQRFPAIILRVAGIYGPGRGYWFQRYLKNQVKILGHGDRLLNMIHQEDLVGVILAALKNARPGEIYNAVDDEPVTLINYFRWLSETLGKWMPRIDADLQEAARKRGITSKKVCNRKLKMELGYAFQYPTFRQGYCAEIKRLDQAGELEIEPEPR